MEISASNYNNPVNFYPKNTGNNINMSVESDPQIYSTNVFMSEFVQQPKIKTNVPAKKKRRSKRLNTIDSEYFPDETEEIKSTKPDGNFFIEQKSNPIKPKIVKMLKSVPLINYFFLKQKTRKIKNTVESLNNINQNVDELVNTAVPYGERTEVYQALAKNLTEAANIIGMSNKEL